MNGGIYRIANANPFEEEATVDITEYISNVWRIFLKSIRRPFVLSVFSSVLILYWKAMMDSVKLPTKEIVRRFANKNHGRYGVRSRSSTSTKDGADTSVPITHAYTVIIVTLPIFETATKLGWKYNTKHKVNEKDLNQRGTGHGHTFVWTSELNEDVSAKEKKITITRYTRRYFQRPMEENFA